MKFKCEECGRETEASHEDVILPDDWPMDEIFAVCPEHGLVRHEVDAVSKSGDGDIFRLSD